jgi:hypothetical protein
MPASISRARLVPEIVAPIMGALLLAALGTALFLVIRQKRRRQQGRLREQEEERRPLGGEPGQESEPGEKRVGEDGTQGVWLFVPTGSKVKLNRTRTQLENEGVDEPPPAYAQVTGK